MRLRALLDRGRTNGNEFGQRSTERRLNVETLEPRMLLAADCLGALDPDAAACSHDAELHVLFDAGTPQSYVDQVHDAIGHDDHQDADAISRYQASTRWGTTATDGSGLTWGDGTTVTWSIAPDGTAIGGFAGEAAAPSNFVAFMSGIYGSSAGDIDDQPWFDIIASSFDRWSEVTAINFVYEASDDGAAFSSSARGVSGIRGDIRIGGHRIDGNSGTLAYNFFPNNGDMVIDTADGFYNSTGNGSLRLRNVLAHEIGHGIGISHVEPVNGTKLMEPYVNTSFDGPQHDDILAGHRLYGDIHEPGSGNDSFGTATDLGNLGGSSITIGTHSADEYLSIDDDTDADYFQFTAGAGSLLNVALDPVGLTYQQGPQGGAGSNFNSQAQSDLRLDVYDASFTLIASANSTGLGGSEALSDVELAAGGTYFVRVTGAQDAAQFYELQVSATEGSDHGSPGDTTAADIINFNEYTIDGYGGGQDHSGAVSVQPNGAALELNGNRWKKIDFNYTITPNTVMEFDFSSTSQGEIHGIGFDSNLGISSGLTFRVHGTQNWGIGDFDNYSPSGTQHYVIPVGQFYTGNASYLFFTNDHDVSSPTANSLFSNVKVYEADGGTVGPTAPTATGDAFTVNEDASTTTLNVLANDDDGGGTLAISEVSSGSAGGTINISGGQNITYRPAADFFGTETFTYTVTNEAGSSTATVTINVQSVNDAPTAVGDAFTVDEGSQNNVFDVLANDTFSPDVNETLRVVSVGSGSAGGTITTDGNRIYYTPAAGFSGTETFNYTLGDGTPGSTDAASVTVTVEPQQPSGEINFNDVSIDSYGGGQDYSGSATVLDGGATLRLVGNTWKKINLPYTITSNTVLEFEFSSNAQGEIHGIGFDSNTSISSNLTFQIYGSQNWGIQNYDNYAKYDPAKMRYTISVGKFYTGSALYLFFTNDHDVRNPNAVSQFSNVRIYESNAVQAIAASDGVDTSSGTVDRRFAAFGGQNSDTPARGSRFGLQQVQTTIAAGSVVTPINTAAIDLSWLRRLNQSNRALQRLSASASSNDGDSADSGISGKWASVLDRAFAGFGG